MRAARRWRQLHNSKPEKSRRARSQPPDKCSSQLGRQLKGPQSLTCHLGLCSAQAAKNEANLMHFYVKSSWESDDNHPRVAMCHGETFFYSFRQLHFICGLHYFFTWVHNSSGFISVIFSYRLHKTTAQNKLFMGRQLLSGVEKNEPKR